MPRKFEKERAPGRAPAHSQEVEVGREDEGAAAALPVWQPEHGEGDVERFIRYCRAEKCPDFQAGHCELHKPMQCFYFHFEGQRRRPPIGPDGTLRYWELPCKWISQPSKCPFGDRCVLAHSKGEISYHPAKYKTRVCNGGDCQKATCCFAHSEKELRSKAAARYSHAAVGGDREAPLRGPSGPAGPSHPPPVPTAIDKAEGPTVVDLHTFKVFPCRKGRGVHDRKLCPFFHNPRDRRRPPGTYAAEPCDECFDSMADSHREGTSSGSTRSCSRGDACQLCHNRLELLYHDSVFKRRFCATFPTVSSCQRGDLCAFAHSRKEVRVELLKPEEEELMTEWFSGSEASQSPEARSRVVDFFTRRFKTLWCPYGTQHGWHECLYAHTDQDWRRRPELGYSSEPCTEWAKHVGERLPYAERCCRGLRCPFAHGSKEQLYHPAYYKTMPCTDWAADGSCPRGLQCAFYHGPEEQRLVTEAVLTASPALSPSARRRIPEVPSTTALASVQAQAAALRRGSRAAAGAPSVSVFSVQELETALAARSVQDACATRLDPASVAGSVDGATTLSGRSGMRTSFGSLASLASLASSNSGSPAFGPLAPLPGTSELEPAYVRLPPMWEHHLGAFPEDEATTKNILRL